MKGSVKLLAGLAFAIVLATVAFTVSASAADKWSASPSTVPAGAFCIETEALDWYQVQHTDEDGLIDFVGSTIACSGWDAIWRFALINDYPSVNAAGLEVVAGNRGKIWLGSLPDIGTYSP